MSSRHSTLGSFSYAIEGIKTAIKEEPNFKIHLVVAGFVLLLGYFLKISQSEWIILLFAISLVLILELINTSLEAIVDLVSPEIRIKAKIAKDVSAAAVLLSALIAFGVGLIVFLPKFL